MTIDVTNVLDQRLTTGSDDGTGTAPCVMNAVHARWLLRNGVYTTGSLTDMPECTDPLVARIAQVVNDLLPEERLSELGEDFQVRLMLAHAPADPMVARRVRVRTLIWAAESVVHLVPERDRDVCEAAVATAQRWLEGTATEEECAYASAARAAPALNLAAYAAAAAVRVAPAYAAAAAEMDLVEWLDDLLTAHEKARAIEGVLHEEVEL